MKDPGAPKADNSRLREDGRRERNSDYGTSAQAGSRVRDKVSGYSPKKTVSNIKSLYGL